MTRLSSKRTPVHRRSSDAYRRRFVGAVGVTLMLIGLTAGSAGGAMTLPVLWTAGGSIRARQARVRRAGGLRRRGQCRRGIRAHRGRDLAVTSYTPTGTLRWRRTVSPTSGTFQGDWIVAAPNGDFVAVGHNVTSSGNPIAITLVRYGSDGTLLWRVDLAGTRPSVARLLVDARGNAYLAFSSVGDGQDIQVHKYNPSGALLWSQVISTGFFANDIATSLALSPDETDVVVTGDIVGRREWITAAYNATTGARRWLVTAAEGIAARDVVVDATRVYVTGQGNVGITGFLTVVAYDRATGARLWRTDKKPADAAERRRSPDGPGARREPRRHRPGLSWVPRLVHGGVRDHRRGSVGGRSRRRIEHGRDPARRAGAGRWHHRRDGTRRSQPSGRVHPGCHGRIWPERDLALGGVLEDGDGVGDRPPRWRCVRHGRLRRADHMLARSPSELVGSSFRQEISRSLIAFGRRRGRRASAWRRRAQSSRLRRPR